MERYRWLSAVGLAAIVAAIFACGDGESLELDCGEGTVVEGGECVPGDSICDGDRVLTPEDECSDDPEDFVCDQGTVYDHETQQCVSTADVQCGEGTIEEGGECVLEDALTCGVDTVLFDGECVVEESVCGEGTDFDDEEIECHPGADACEGTTVFDVGVGECVETVEVECGEGTEQVDNRCVSTDSHADQLAADADIEHADGEPIVPSTDDEFIFTGVLDSELSQTFELEGSQGEWLEITVYSRGVPSPGFSVSSLGGGWERGMPAGRVGASPSRTVLVPGDETFYLTVETRLADEDSWSGGGDDTWEYVGVVEVVDAPEPASWPDIETPLEGTLDDPMANFVEVDVDQAYDLVVTPVMFGDDVEAPTLEIWSDIGAFDERFDLAVDDEVSIDVADESTVYMHVDAVELTGSDVDFEVVGRPTSLLEPSETYETEVVAEAGEVVFLTHESNEIEPVDIEVLRDGESMYLFEDALAANQSSYEAEETKRRFFYVRESGTYTIRYHNESEGDLTGFVASAEADDEVPVFEVPPTGSGSIEAWFDDEELEQGDWRIVVLDTPGQSLFEVEAESESGSPRISVYDEEHQEILEEWMSGNDADFHFQTGEAGVYYLAVRPSGTFTLASNIQLDILSQAVDLIDPGEVYRETYDAALHDLLIGRAGFSVGEEVDIRLLNANDVVLREETSVDSNIEFFELLPGDGTYTVEVENTGDDPIPAAYVDARLYEPFDSLELTSDSSAVYDRSSLEQNESEYLVFQYQDGVGFVADFDVDLKEDEEVAIRLWDIDRREVVYETDDFEEVASTQSLPALARYAVEIEGLTEVTDYELTLEGRSVYFVDEYKTHDPPLVIDSEDSETSSMSVDTCDDIADVTVAADIPSGTSSSIAVVLTAPGVDESFELEDDHWNTPGGGVYPDEHEPTDSLDPLFGTSAVGEWTLEVTNTSSFSDAELAEWSLHLDCWE